MQYKYKSVTMKTKRLRIARDETGKVKVWRAMCDALLDARLSVRAFSCRALSHVLLLSRRYQVSFEISVAAAQIYIAAALVSYLTP